MFLNFGVLINAVLVVLGLIWCREMLGRWRRDREELRSTGDAGVRQALVILWVVTALVVILLIDFLVGILGNVGVL